ncbi:MFS transporter [Thaumasiovibrio subtropicus]|uniref:MFS transporter n=1 Tax=Thaumasiovibrio subtropicus TaxID=1891207 RepID=UPI000B36161F|nr:MFS transporter [Thaumasiovibrio subtropicus]
MASSLLTQRRFLPYFTTQALGAFNDNVYKNVLLIFVAFAAPGTLPLDSDLIVNLAAGLFILPFFLFSASAGVIADKFEKSALIRIVKIAEVLIMSMAAFAILTQNFTIMLLLLFLMGTQSAFFGPVKYALLPQTLKQEELVNGNALVETGTFLAILTGTILAGVIANAEQAYTLAAIAVVAFAVMGYFSARAIPHIPAVNPDMPLKWAPISQTKQTLAIAKKDKVVFQCILGISWFWFLGASYLTQFANFTKDYLGGNAAAVSFLLTLFSVGIALGSQLCTRLSGHRVEPGIVPLGSIGLTLFGIDLMFATPDIAPVTTTFVEFLLHPELRRVFFDLLMIGVFGGLFIVPLYAMMQQRANEDERARVIAANNIYNSLFMVTSAISGIVLLGIIGISIPEFFLILAVINAIVALYVYLQIPEFFLRLVVWMISHTMYRVTHRDLDRIPEKGGVLLVCNHVSYMDALLLAGACRRPIRFVMDKTLSELPLLKYFFRRSKVIPICPKDRRSVAAAFNKVDQCLAEGEVVCIFPEGQITYNGEIGIFKRGVDTIINRSPVPVVPLALQGLWGSWFSRESGKAFLKRPKRFWSRVTIVAGEAVAPEDVTPDMLRERVIALRGENA